MVGFRGESIPPNTKSVYLGISIRDYFAAKALQGIAAGPVTHRGIEDAAAFSYRLADAMLAAREQ